MKAESQGSLPPRVLIIDDDEGVAESLRLLVEQEGGVAHVVTHPAQVEGAVDTFHPHLILCDLRLPGSSGRMIAEEMMRRHPEVPLAFMSAYGTLDTAQDLLRSGALEYLQKPIRREQLRDLFRRLLPPAPTALQAQPAPPSARYGPLVGQHPLMRNLYEIIERVAPFSVTVLIRGESGSGKELVARVIHEKSPRSGGPFVAVNCGAIPGTLLESELFGYTKGAFTGADRDRPGLIQEARGGTLFLDEIGELPLDLQVKLLRVLEEGKVLPLGSTRAVPVDVRWISATNRDLNALIKEGHFRHDLYYRLKVIEIELPPLRSRISDLPLIAGDWLHTLNQKYGKAIEGVEPPAVQKLLDYTWPGNVRELQNILERAYILCEGSWITAEALEGILGESTFPAGSSKGSSLPRDLDLPRAIQELEVKFIEEALRRTEGNRTRAARLLKISHRALLYKIKEYNISIPPPSGSSASGARD